MVASDFINLPVHHRHLLQVQQFIATLPHPDADEAGDGGTPSNPEPVEQQHEPTPAAAWDVELLRRLRAGNGLVNERAAAIMDTLCATPGDQLTLADLVQATGVDFNRLRGTLSALTRHLTAYYDGLSWPFKWAWHTHEDGTGEARYWVTDEMAAMWRQVRDN